MMSLEEIKQVMQKPKSAEHWEKYVIIYKQITGTVPRNGCSSCRLTHTYNTILQWLNKQ